MSSVPLLSYDSPRGTPGSVAADTDGRGSPGLDADAPRRIIVPFDGVKLGGEPFPWATVGDWILTLPPDGIATLTVNIAVTLGPTPLPSGGG